MPNQNKYKFILQQIRKTHQEWEDIKNYFNNITDPDLIDYAIYYMKGIEKKYEYFLKKAKNIESWE